MSLQNVYGCDCTHWVAMGVGNNEHRILICVDLQQRGLKFNKYQNELQTSLHKAVQKQN